MTNRNKNQNQGAGGLDLVTPFVEIFAEILKVLLELLQILIESLVKLCFEKYQIKFNNVYPQKVLTREMTNSKKWTDDSRAIGYAHVLKRPLLLSELETERHTGIVGSTGSGKSVLINILQERALSSGRSIIFFDPKTTPESVEKFKKNCEKYNRKAYIITDFSRATSIFNPLLEGRASEITERIMNALDWSEPYYKNESQMALFKAVSQLKNVHKEDVTFKRLLELLDKGSEKKSISGLISQLFNIETSSFSEIINGNLSNSLTFKRIRDEGACVYLGISAIGIGSSGNALNKLFFGALLHHCKESYYHDDLNSLKPFGLFFDELSSIIHQGFIDLQNKCRGAKMEITYATQCPSDIDRLSENLTTQIFENTNNLFIFNQMVPKHTEFFAKTCGTVRSKKMTYAIHDGRRGEDGSERETEEFLSHANIIRGLKVGQCVLLQRNPRRVDLINVRYPRYTVGQRNTNTANRIPQSIA